MHVLVDSLCLPNCLLCAPGLLLTRTHTCTHIYTTHTQVASQAVSTMPSILLWPLLPFVLEVGLIIYWVAVSAVLYSAGEPTAHWRQPHDAYQPLGIKQLMLTNTSMTTPTPPAAPDTTNMTALVSTDQYAEEISLPGG